MAKRAKGKPGPPARQTPEAPPVPPTPPAGLLPGGLGPLAVVGVCAVLAALALAPILGGLPAGSLYGQDPVLGVLRVLVLVAGLTPQPPSLLRSLALTGKGELILPRSRGVREPSPNRRLDAEHREPVVLGSPFPVSASERSREGGWGVRYPGGVGIRPETALWIAFALTLVSLLWHSHFFTSDVLLFAMLPATLDWLCCALVFTLAARLARDRRALGLLVLALVAGGAWAALAGAQEYGQNVQMGSRALRVQAFFLNPNFLAGLLALCLPVVAALTLRARSHIGVLAGGATTALMVGTLAATGSRLGVAAAGAGLLVALGLALACRMRLQWGRIGALVAAVLLIGWGFRGPLLGRVSGSEGSQEHSGTFRAWTWKGTLRLARANPVLGTGPGTYAFRYPPYALVAKTNLAHSSYLQMAAEQGFPALLAALAALGLTFARGIAGVLRRPGKGGETESSSSAERLLVCGLCGALAAGVIRSAFDSEWFVLGTALPFWAVAGMVAGAAEALTPVSRRATLTPVPSPASGRGVPKTQRLPASREAGDGGTIGTPLPPAGEGTGVRGTPRETGTRAFQLAFLALALALTLTLLFNAVALEQTMALRRQDRGAAAARAEGLAGMWPPNPEALALLGRYDEAARVEPSGRSWFRLARAEEQRGRTEEAVRAFEQSLRAEPTSLQTLRALAEARERVGDRAGALAAWRDLVRLHEGPTGQARALPELPDLQPAWAYAALAEAAEQSDPGEAAGLYERAAAVVEDYADTSLVYQRLEVAGALQSGVDLGKRRAASAALYEKVMGRLLALAPPERAGALRERRAKTRALLDKLLSTGNGA